MKLGISQSVLTRSIQDMERSVGVALFDRLQAGPQPTAVGRDIVAEAEVLRRFDDFTDFVGGAVSGTRGRVAIGVAPALAPSLLPRLSVDLLKQSHSELFLPVRKPAVLRQMLLDDEIDLCICPEASIIASDLEAIPIGAMALTLLVRPDHPLLLRDEAKSLPNFPIVSASQYHEGVLLPDTLAPLVKHHPQLVLEDHECLSLVTQGSNAVWITSTAAAVVPLRQGKLVEVSASSENVGLPCGLSPTVSAAGGSHRWRWRS